MLEIIVNLNCIYMYKMYTEHKSNFEYKSFSGKRFDLDSYQGGI